jgi:excinuclease ABC subunit C
MASAPRAVIGRLPAGPGVYRFRDARGRILYVGRATALRSRVGSYWGDLRDRRHLVRMVPQIARVEAVACDSVHEAAWLERNLLERAKPRWNRVVGGAEEPMCIRLSHRAGVARLTAVHWAGGADPGGADPGGAQTFGPYLGGNRTRLAVSALDRVLPLWATDARLGGFQRDLARVRGVDTADRDRFLTTVMAVLRRQRAAVEAVRDELAGQRDRAAARLAFEHAGRLQVEIEAIDWIVAEQKVTPLVPMPDGEVHGWHDGLLVGFRVRGGRLCDWTQRACRQPAARPYLDRTPAGWSAFAARAAELGSRLTGPHA